jgi:hypothetical protein
MARARQRAARELEQAARHVLEATHGPGEGPITVVIFRGQVVIMEETPAPAPPPTATPAAELTPLQEQLVGALTEQPQTSGRIARSIKHRHDSYLREQLATLADRGLARRVRGGYRRP